MSQGVIRQSTLLKHICFLVRQLAEHAGARPFGLTSLVTLKPDWRHYNGVLFTALVSKWLWLSLRFMKAYSNFNPNLKA